MLQCNACPAQLIIDNITIRTIRWCEEPSGYEVAFQPHQDRYQVLSRRALHLSFLDECVSDYNT